MTKTDYLKFDYVQIGGNHKSGTSLLLALLDNHPDIAAFSSETSLTGLLYPILVDPSVSKERKLKAIIAKRCSKETDGYVPVSVCNLIEVGNRLRVIMEEQDNTLETFHFGLVKAFYDEFDPTRLASSRIWVDKSPLSHLFADEIFERFPNPKFIHILREPKNNFSSIGGTALKRIKSRTAREALLWRYRIWSAQSFYYAKRNHQKFGEERYKVIRYEELVRNPQQVVPELAEFLGIAVTDSLYQPTRAGYAYAGNSQTGLKFEGISAVNVDRWKERIPLYYARVMEAQSAENLKQFGYHRHFNPREIKQALFFHRLLTKVIPRSTLLRIYHPQHFISPEPSVPGLPQRK